MPTVKENQEGEGAGLKVLFVCMGNICRSPAAEGIFREYLHRAGHAETIHVDSAGTLDYHAGSPPDERMRKVVRSGTATARPEHAHSVQNGLLLRSDVHRLFDAGYITVTPDYHVEASGRMREDFNDGENYLRLHGTRVRVPPAEGQRPSREALVWHNENRLSISRYAGWFAAEHGVELWMTASEWLQAHLNRFSGATADMEARFAFFANEKLRISAA